MIIQNQNLKCPSHRIIFLRKDHIKEHQWCTIQNTKNVQQNKMKQKLKTSKDLIQV